MLTSEVNICNNPINGAYTPIVKLKPQIDVNIFIILVIGYLCSSILIFKRRKLYYCHDLSQINLIYKIS